MTATDDRLLAQTAELLRPDALTAVLREHFGTCDELTITGRAQSGSSNVTAFVTFGDRELVVRRPPAGELLPTAHDVGREYAFHRALHGSSIPVARPILQCDDPAVIGAPFYVMERVRGYVLQHDAPASASEPSNVERICGSAITTLAALHEIEWSGLHLPGRPTGYLDRQVRRWTSQLSLTSTATRLTGIERLTSWVTANVPDEGDVTIVHGDYGLHNLMFGEPDHCVAAVMDWEMATLGDPLADVTWFLEGWDTNPSTPSRNPANWILSLPGALTRAQMYDRYSQSTGRDVSNLAFYRAFNAWKGIVILEGLYAAYLEGNAADESVSRFADDVPARLAQVLQELAV